MTVFSLAEALSEEPEEERPKTLAEAYDFISKRLKEKSFHQLKCHTLKNVFVGWKKDDAEFSFVKLDQPYETYTYHFNRDGKLIVRRKIVHIPGKPEKVEIAPELTDSELYELGTALLDFSAI